MSKRYTAIVEIIEVEETPGVKDRYDRQKDVPAFKDSKELAKFIVRDSDLEALKVKLGKHVELV